MLIYLIKNRINQKVYIGKTISSFEKRMRSHKSDSNTRKHTVISRAIRKYGWNNFDFSVLEDGIQSVDLMNKKEREYIVKFDSTNPSKGYNITMGGDGGLGMNGIKNGMFGKKRPDLSLRNKSNTGKHLSKEQRQKISESNKNKKHSESSKKIMSEVREKAWRSGKYNNSKFGQHTIGVTPKWVTVRVRCVELDMIFESLREAADFIGGVHSNISSVLSGRLKTYKGYTFERI